ncbi:pollen protein Ole E I-like protein [Medicago truncatula]|uniref:Pollen protein Ole E I-like protein n=1 Tax=Medicago truncatula TaxID=3880 RepID=G7LBD6_MEDTR|nr:pollen protein Ole E I-like protein [Medicago truncatula]
MTKALAFLLLLLQLTSFSAFAEDTSDTFNDIFDFDADDDALNAFSKEFETLHKPSHAHSLNHQSPASSPHHHFHSPSPAPSRHHQSLPPSLHQQPHAPSPHHHSPSPAPSLPHQSPAASPHHQFPAPSPHHHLLPLLATNLPLRPLTTNLPLPPLTTNLPLYLQNPQPITTLPSVMVVRGVVYVKSCNYSGFDTLKKATPLLGPVVKLQCNNTKYKLDETDKDGHFSLVGPKIITIYTAKQCDVVLVSAPHGLKPSNLHNGITGVILRPKRRFVSKGVPFILFGTQPLAFEPSCPH